MKEFLMRKLYCSSSHSMSTNFSFLCFDYKLLGTLVKFIVIVSVQAKDFDRESLRVLGTN